MTKEQELEQIWQEMWYALGVGDEQRAEELAERAKPLTLGPADV